MFFSLLIDQPSYFGNIWPSPLIMRATFRGGIFETTDQKMIYSVSQKLTPKLFAIFSLRLSIFPWNFINLLPIYIHVRTNFSWLILILSKMVNRSMSTYHHQYLSVLLKVVSFTKSNFRDFIISDEWPPGLANINSLEYQVWGQCWSLITSCYQKNSARV